MQLFYFKKNSLEIIFVFTWNIMTVNNISYSTTPALPNDLSYEKEL